MGHTNDWCISTGQVHEPPELPGMGPPGVLGIWEEWLFIFRELGSTGNYLRGAKEQSHNFGDIGSLAKKQKKKKRKSLHFV